MNEQRATSAMTLLAGLALLAGLICAQAQAVAAAPIALLCAGAGLGLALLGRAAQRQLATSPRGRVLAASVVVLVAIGVAQGLGAPPHVHPHPARLPELLLEVLPAGAIVAVAAAGLVLLADEARARVGRGETALRPWDLLAGRRRRGPREVPSVRVVAGTGLLLTAGLTGIVLTGTYLRGHMLLQLLIGTAVALTALLAILTPLAVSTLAALDRARVRRGQEQERERLAAHLHDSVLQTLALIRRQADDPTAIDRLAREQEEQLRAWMAGGTSLGGQTLAGALRQAADEASDGNVQLTVTGDRELDDVGEVLVGSAREALRNAARHAPQAKVFLYAQITAAEIAIFVRDDGPGFELDAIPAERRGVRDSILRRMHNAGGSATIDTEPGSGTEVTLRIRPHTP